MLSQKELDCFDKAPITNVSMLQKLCNIIYKDILINRGLPPIKNHVFILDETNEFNGFYDAKEKKINLFIQDRVMDVRYIHTVAHETTHLLQDFVISNRITRNNIDNLSLKQYESYLQKFFKDKTIIPTTEMLNTFKNFVKNEPFFANEVIGQLAYDKYLHTNKTNAYYNNLTELMANINALKYIKSRILNNPEIRLSRLQNNELRGIVNKILNVIERIKPAHKKRHNVLQAMISPYKFLQFINYKNKAQISISKNPSQLLINFADEFMKVREEMMMFLSKNNEDENINSKQSIEEQVAEFIIKNCLNTNIEDLHLEDYEKIKFATPKDLLHICNRCDISEIAIDVVNMVVLVPQVDVIETCCKEIIKQPPNEQKEKLIKENMEIEI